MTHDWEAEIDRWTERFRGVDGAPEPFASALVTGWTAEAKQQLAAEAEAYARQHEGYVREIAAAGVDLVRFDAKLGACGVCEKYVGKAFTLTGATPELPPAPPLPICPACRHTLNLLTPFFLQSMNLDLDDLVADAQPFVDG